MNKTLARVLLLPFLAYSLWVTYELGYFGFVTVSAKEPWALQIFLDLVIALTMAIVPMLREVRRRGQSIAPWLIGTLALGSITPLFYYGFYRRED